MADQPPEMVPYYDFDTKRVIRMPASELAPGLAQARVAGIDEIVWIDPAQIKHSAIRHPELSAEIMVFVRQIEETFREFHPMSVKKWEEGFRRDLTPGKEISMWLHAGEVYRFFTQKEPSKARRKEVFIVVVTGLNSSYDNIRLVLPPLAMDEERLKEIIDRFYQT